MWEKKIHVTEVNIFQEESQTVVTERHSGMSVTPQTRRKSLILVRRWEAEAEGACA